MSQPWRNWGYPARPLPPGRARSCTGDSGSPGGLCAWQRDQGRRLHPLWHLAERRGWPRCRTTRCWPPQSCPASHGRWVNERRRCQRHEFRRLAGGDASCGPVARPRQSPHSFPRRSARDRPARLVWASRVWAFPLTITTASTASFSLYSAYAFGKKPPHSSLEILLQAAQKPSHPLFGVDGADVGDHAGQGHPFAVIRAFRRVRHRNSW
jgi:hypothetical protein